MELFVGKGGVGKTTLACATALAYARAGQRVLLASLDQAHSLGDALGFRFQHQPGSVPGVAAVQPGLDVIEVDSLALLEDRFRTVLLLLSGAGDRHGVDISALDPAELTGLPGIQELLALLEITDFAGVGRWDVIVLDCPPSADMLRIVTAPDTLLGYLDRVWPAHARTLTAVGGDFRRAMIAVSVEQIVTLVTAARDLLADRSRTTARLVTAPEHVAVAESTRVRSAAALLGLELTGVLVNKVLPELEDAESAALRQDPAAFESGAPALIGPDDDTATVAAWTTRRAGPASWFGTPAPPAHHPAVRWYSERQAEQSAVVEDLRKRMGGVPVQVVRHAGAEPVGLAALTALSHGIDASGDWVGGGSVPMLGSDADDGLSVSGGPQVRHESGTGLASVFAMRMHLPVVDPSTLQLGRVEDDLIVGADGVRRRLRLAPVLRRCTVEAAELDGDQLVIRFRPDPEVWPK
ncbi:ArsA family ATPase [Nocardia sp. NPDC005978]|uniref:ArsA family ATPase n=1 Tax=Nocardia sp. NPDC005978 TaxID=3156725 RepID=UPI0033AE5365